MPAFPKPSFEYDFNFSDEVTRLRRHKRFRNIPRRSRTTLLVATWNIANLGLQLRSEKHLMIIAEIIRWFDLIAVQEVNENFGDLERLVHLLGTSYRSVFTDTAGNNERMAYIYHSRKIKLLEKIGEIAIPPSQHRWIKLPEVTQQFTGFDRNPYIASFSFGNTSMLLVNVHLYFGSNSKPNIDRRALETYAVGRWVDLRRKSRFSFTREMIALGDFNMPKAQPGDRIYNALTRRGLELPGHSSVIGSSIASDNRYDQIAFLPGETKNAFSGKIGVFDFDGVIFQDLWHTRGRKDFNSYLRYYVSDHRPMWIEFTFQ